MGKRLNVYTVGMDSAWCDKEENFRILEEYLHQMPGNTDLVILPEMFSTGFITDDAALIREQSERNSGTSMTLIKSLSAKYNVAIAGTFLAVTPPKIYNRAFFIEPDGTETFYDKKHLFSPGNEAKNYTAGCDTPPIIRYRGWNIMPIICYDLRFPCWCRNVNMKYDLMIVPANWPKTREYAWKQLLIARAIENQCYVCGANRSGADTNGLEFPENSSLIINHKGQEISQEITSNSNWASLDGEALACFREKFPVWKDADFCCC